MPSGLPSTREEILETGVIDLEFAEALENNPIPSGSFYTMEDLKALLEYSISQVQKQLRFSLPDGINESQHYISLRDGYKTRVIICHGAPRPSSGSSPLMILLHGGGHCVGFPEQELPLARLLVLTYNIVVVLPVYRLAPEYPFPQSIKDTWDIVQWVAAESQKQDSTVLPAWTNTQSGFIVGGTSAGAGLTAAVAHIARDHKLNPPLTGQFLCAGTYMSHLHVPAKYQNLYLARQQNAYAPVLDIDLYNLFHGAFKPDHLSPLWASFDQHTPEDKEGEIKAGHMGLPPTYFQICGLDLSRDDGLIYEKVLREECAIPTRTDLYPGYPHCWWLLFPKMRLSETRMKDTVEGIGWLLQVGKGRGD